ncbi:probable methyltransferase PMT26 [Vicia villosa]|uniref:probable methyltransferase PMT26 n=1 Tax=Vicia villosa TaxID=3911 RepID=UPI00273B8B96|nr:probable methyltransferase PMT26 [Vicia villosa]XP_058756519.1 probable methyltransferase PMT26 [Vicia villosa]XP_058756520.1 probable methyltransferase PMT26 [Vicia villosa]
MAIGKYSRVDGRRSASGYCSTVTIVVLVALCLVGVWVMTSSSVAPVLNGGGEGDVAQESKNEVKEQSEVKEPASENDNSNGRQFEDNPGDLPEDATKGDSNVNSEEKSEESSTEKSVEDTKTEDEGKKTEEEGANTENVEQNSEATESNKDGGESTKESDSDESEKKDETDDSNKSTDNNIEEKVEQSDNKESDDNSSEKNTDDNAKDQSSTEVYPSGGQSELLNENSTQTGSFSTQATESKNEKESQESSKTGYNWKVCNVTAGPDFIPCLDNWKAIRSLRSTKHYEHRERHCPEEPPTCLVSLPEGYKRSIEWPKSRDKIWYYNVPHTKLAEVKGHQNWVKVTGEYLTFPGGGTQFKHGALHYIDFIQETLADIAWGKRTRVILDVGCGVASFGGFLFDRDVLAMSLAPKDEHEAQVQFALERGIPAISAVMGTKRLPFPGRVFDAVHCARCRVPWHIEGGKLLLELNRVLRPGGYFIWSATPIYQKLPEDVEIWNEMKALTKSICWELVAISKDQVNGVGVAIYKKPLSNECYEKRLKNEPPLCPQSDDPNAAWYIKLQACIHKVPVSSSERGSQWPEKWPARLTNVPYWLSSSQVGVYGKPAPEDFAADDKHWKNVVSKSYLDGMGIKWSNVRNVMDMNSIYGGFAAALKDLKIWVMNVVSIESADTLPIIYERGLFGIYHDWCESFSTYPRSYDLLHADHLFSKVKKRCSLASLLAEVDRILRPEGKLIVRDTVEIINELESMVKSMQWEVRMTYSKDKEGLLCVQKSKWRPKETETLQYAIV